MRNPCPRLHIAAAVAAPQRDSNLGPVTPQSDALSTRLLRPESTFVWDETWSVPCQRAIVVAPQGSQDYIANTRPRGARSVTTARTAAAWFNMQRAPTPGLRHPGDCVHFQATSIPTATPARAPTTIGTPPM